jgi:hypothetical protein
MRLRDIDDNITLYKYEWVELDPREKSEYILCEYILNKPQLVINQTVDLLNLITEKISIVSQEKLDKEFSETKKDATIRAIQHLNFLIAENSIKNNEFIRKIDKLLNTYIQDSWNTATNLLNEEENDNKE